MSNKTPKESVKKTKSALKDNRLLLLVVVILVGIMGFSIWGMYETFIVAKKTPMSSQPEQATYDTTCLRLVQDTECIATLEIADDDAKRIKGLSGRESMAEDRGMLFVSDTVEKQCFWMRDMQFSLDMIWVDESKRITQIEENITPETYPQQYCSPDKDKYVIELNAGQSKALGLKTGQTLVF